jgi:hypothetical protein
MKATHAIATALLCAAGTGGATGSVTPISASGSLTMTACYRYCMVIDTYTGSATADFSTGFGAFEVDASAGVTAPSGHDNNVGGTTTARMTANSGSVELALRDYYSITDAGIGGELLSADNHLAGAGLVVYLYDRLPRRPRSRLRQHLQGRRTRWLRRL